MSRSTRIPTSCKFTAPKERTAPLTGFPGRGAFFRIQVVFLLYKGGEGPLPSFRFAKCHCPFLSPGGDIFPRPGGVFRRESPWQRGEVSSLFVNGRKKPAVMLQTFRPCQSLSLSGEVARRSRDGEGLLPLPNFFQIFLLSVQETSPLLRVRIQRGTQSTRKASLASLCPQPYRKEAVQA